MPLYESAMDLARERIVIENIQTMYGVDFLKLDIRHAVDGVVIRGKTIVGVVEIKCRNHPLGKYPTLMIDRSKLDEGMTYARKFECPFTLFVSFAGNLRFLKMDYRQKGRFPVGMGGRDDRGDPNDRDEVYFIPEELFKIPRIDSVYGVTEFSN